MNENTATGGGSGVNIAGPLAENEHIKELLGILKDNGKDTAGLNALINHVSEMENFVKQAEVKISDMKSQLDTMKETQDHPIRNALQTAIKGLETKVAEIKVQLSELKNNMIDGCKNAVTAFKEKGAAALDKVASFFNIKSGLQSMNKNIDASIKMDDKAITKIEAFSKEYHTAGRHIKNMGRVLTGKPPIDAVKESGKLAKVINAPYKAHRAVQVKLKGAVEKMIGKLETLSKNAEVKRSEREPAEKEKKPSLIERLKEKKELIKQKELETPKLERAPKSRGLEI